jgi:predicted amidohydrolase
VGAPAWPADGRPAVQQPSLLINDSGELLARTDKDGLTFVETLFFQPGQGRPVVPLQGLRCATVLCREVEEAALLHEQLPPGSADLVLWPSLARCGTLEPLAAELAQHGGAHWVQCNAPNAPNTPDDDGLGGSVVIAPDGRVLLQLPADEAGLVAAAAGAGAGMTALLPATPRRRRDGDGHPAARHGADGFSDAHRGVLTGMNADARRHAAARCWPGPTPPARCSTSTAPAAWATRSA